ncbi:hypothetical protein TKK_0003868 [Trichogramma kaykai]
MFPMLFAVLSGLLEAMRRRPSEGAGQDSHGDGEGWIPRFDVIQLAQVDLERIFLLLVVDHWLCRDGQSEESQHSEEYQK